MGCKNYYFSGAYSQKLKIEMNIDQLFSFYHERALVTKIIKYKREHPEYTANIMLDSGAYSHFQNSLKKGIVLTDKELYEYTDDYIKFLNEWGEDLTCFVGVDTVPDPNNVDPTYIVKTFQNYLYMYQRLDPSIRHKLIPVFHYGEDFNALKQWLEYKHEDGTPIDYIGLAISLEGSTKERIKWGRECMRLIAQSSNPHVKTHAFGVGVRAVLEHIDVTSTDATSWVKSAAFGMVKIEDKPYGVSTVCKEALSDKHYNEKSAGNIEAVEQIVKQRGYSIDPITCTYTITSDVLKFTEGVTTHTLKLTSNISELLFDETDRYTLASTYEKKGDEDKFFGNWECGERSIQIDGFGRLIYDNGRCLSTNCYARARFNIEDVLKWMDEINNKPVALATKQDLW